MINWNQVFASYFSLHFLCNAHIEKGLPYLPKKEGINLGNRAKRITVGYRWISFRIRRYSPYYIYNFHYLKKYSELVDAAFFFPLVKNCLLPPTGKGKHDRFCKNKSSLFGLKVTYFWELWHCMSDKDIPWSNNRSEEPLCFIKVRQKNLCAWYLKNS
jgi:hypothetical protein